MHYIVVTEFESPEESTCKIMGLPLTDIHQLFVKLIAKDIPCNNLGDSFEADIPGVRLLNFLSATDFNFSVVSQSMAIETTAIGGRTVKIQKLVWTMITRFDNHLVLDL